MFDKAASQFLLERYRPEWADSAAPGSHHDSNKWYGTFLSPEVIFYNHNTLTAEQAPKDWDDLLLPEWKGKIVLRSPMESGTMRSIFSAMIWRHAPDKRNVDPTPGYDWLRRLNANVKRYDNTPELLFQGMSRSREPLVSMWLLSDIRLQRTRYNYPFDYIIPPKTPVLVEGIAIIDRSLAEDDPRRADARLFYEFVTNKENLVRMAESPYFRIPTRTDINPESLPEWIRARDWTEVAMDVNWTRVSDFEKDWMNYWKDEIR